MRIKENMNYDHIAEPFLLEPAGKDYLWGGDRLKELYNKTMDISPLAETWECSTHPDGESIVASGNNKGRSLRSVLKDNPQWLGKHSNPNGEMPVLVKLIDANKDLSVQVHPDDEYALKHEAQLGKTEMWYVMDAEPGAKLVYGFNHDLTPDRLREYINSGTLIKHLNSMPVHRGDVFFIEPGTVHAIGAGIIIAEIQESSNVTYRLYDYGRKDKNGNTRELHIDKALDIINCNRFGDIRQPMHVLRYSPGYAGENLCRCKYFTVEKILLNGDYSFNVNDKSFAIVICIDGEIKMHCRGNELVINKGRTAFIPAGSGINIFSGQGEILVTEC